MKKKASETDKRFPAKPSVLKKRLSTGMAFVLVLTFQSGVFGAKPYPGFNFYSNGNMCYLKDMKGKTLDTWTSKYSVMSHAYLLRDSSVLFPYAVPNKIGVTSEMPAEVFKLSNGTVLLPGIIRIMIHPLSLIMIVIFTIRPTISPNCLRL